MRWVRAATVGSMLWVLGGCAEHRANACERPGCAPDAVAHGDADDGGRSNAGEARGGTGGHASRSDAGNAGGSDAPELEPRTDAGVLRASFEPVGPHRGAFVGVAATPSAVFVATAVSVRRSRDGGESWTILDQLELRDVTAMTAAGSDVFVVANENIYRSRDDGATWQPVPLDQNRGQSASYPTYLSSRGSEVYLLGDGKPYRWNEETASWDALPDEGHVLSFDVLESDGSVLYANQLSRGGVFRLELEAGGTQWTPIEALEQWGYRAFAFSDQDGFTANHAAVFGRSAETGWVPFATPMDRVADLLIERGTIYAAAADGLRESVDQGVSWNLAMPGAFSSSFAVATDGTSVFAVSDELWRKRGPDGAWQAQAVAADEVWRLASAGESMFSISASGFRRASELGEWEAASVPGAGDVASIAIHDGEVFVGMSIGAVYVSADGGRSFVPRSHPGFAGSSGIDFVASIERGLIASVRAIGGSSLFLSTDAAQTWTALPQMADRDYLVGIAEVQGVLLLWANYGRTYRSADQGETFHALAFPEDLGGVGGLAVLQDVVFGASARGGVARSSDLGKSWERVGLEALPVSSLLVHEGIVFAGVGSVYSLDGGVYYSADMGASWARLDPSFGARVSALAVHDGRLVAGTLDQSIWAAPLAPVGAAP